MPADQGTTPAVIAGLVLVGIVLMSMFISTGVVIWRAQQRKRNARNPMDLEKADIINEKLAAEADHNDQYIVSPYPMTISSPLEHSTSKVNVIISPSVSYYCKMPAKDGETNVAVAVMVTPPTPSISRQSLERRVYFPPTTGGAVEGQGAEGNQSVWFMM